MIKMNETYKKAPNILTEKDVLYLKDIFGWNHAAYKEEMETLNYIEEKSVKEMIEEATKLFKENMEVILKIAKEETNEK